MNVSRDMRISQITSTPLAIDHLVPLAALQVLATIPNLIAGHQVMHQSLTEDVIDDGLLEFENGCIAVPDRPGLGIELNRDRVEKFARQYEKVGQYPMNPR